MKRSEYEEAQATIKKRIKMLKEAIQVYSIELQELEQVYKENQEYLASKGSTDD